MSDYFTASGTPADGAGLQSAEVRAEFLAIEAAMDKLPTATGNAGEIIAVNAGATALEAIATTGTGSGVRATSPTLVTPTLGVATATSVNKVTITQPATGSTVTVADGKTLTASNTLTLTATDGSTLAIGTGGTLGTAAYIAATSKQDTDATLTSIALLGTAGDKLAYTTGVDTWAETPVTAFARSILDDANEATFKATVNLEIGTDVQAYDADLTTWAGVTPGTGVATALAVAVGSAGAPVVNGGALGTPASGALDNCTSNTETAANNSTQLATTAYADRLTGGSLAGAFTTLSSSGNATLGDSASDVHTVNGTMVFNHGFTFGTLSIKPNDIGTAGAAGFGVGICPSPPSGMYPLSNGTFNPYDADYGNYQYTDGSVMVWIPAFFIKYGTGANGLAVNVVDIKAESAYADVATANAAGYALHRAFYDGGAVQRGVFVDKYKCSNNGGTASSIRNGNPLSSAAANNPFSGLTGAPANFYYGAIAAAKTRGASFFPGSLFIRSALALLSLAHAQASTSTTWCAWYNATYNFPKGCNNNALSDAQDAALTFTSAGNATYPTANKTGSANVLAKTTHNGQNCGVADLNGTIWEICLGLTSNGTNIYVLKTAAAMKNITASNAGATDAWGATGIAALYDDLGTTYGALWATGANRATYFGNAGQVFSEATSGNAWNAAGAGVPLSGGVGGTNAFGSDGLWDYKPNEMCPLAGGDWSNSSGAGVWALHLAYARGSSTYNVGLRAALYL